jgi:hypothetical protein
VDDLFDVAVRRAAREARGMRALLVGLTILFGVTLGSMAAAAGEPNINGLWRGSIYGSDIQAYVEQQNHTVKAQVLIHDLLGETNIYHVFGVIENGHMVLTHNSGHRFEGDAHDGEIEGTLTTHGGTKVEVKALRVPMPSENGQGSSRQGALGSSHHRPG